MRGILDNLGNDPTYADIEKKWSITLEISRFFWYELIVNSPSEANTKEFITSYLKKLKAEVERTLEKRFIYFFASRQKIRFDTVSKPKYSRFTKELTIKLRIGKNKKKVKLKTKIFLEPTNSPITPDVEVSEKFITFRFNSNYSQTFSIHDFLSMNDFIRDDPTQIHYIGITKNPHDRPINRNHRGISDTLYNVSNEENDFFIFVNLFKVISNAENNQLGLNYIVANSMIDEIKTQEEGEIIESILINYFNPNSQNINKRNEKGILINKLSEIRKTNKIQSISLHLEVEKPNSYFRFSSSSVSERDNHTFICQLNNGEVKYSTFNSEIDLLT